jgi:hypothetical protein
MTKSPKYKTISILFAVLITHYSFLSPVQTFAQDSFTTPPASAPYEMTYPGILPDHPFYFLKVAKDNVIGFFKGDPLDRASFSLLQADKYMTASHMLLTQKKNSELAFSSLQRSQDYLEEAIKQTDAAKKEGVGTQEISQKIKVETKKHTMMMEELAKHIDKKDADKFALEKKRADSLTKTAAALRP